jgi:type II secretory pathway component PulJ
VGLIETLIAMLLALLVLLAVYAFVDSGKREYVAVTDLATAQSAGRAAMDILTAEAMVAGFSPLGAAFQAVPQGDASRVRFLADLDGDGVVGTESETDEDLSYEFVDPDGDGRYELRRGADLNGDGDFTDPGESVDGIASGLLRVDADGDGVAEPFLAYDKPPPLSRRLRVVFGVRTDHRDIVKKQYPVVRFQSEVLLRNRQ